MTSVFADLPGIFAATFGEDVVWTPQGGSPATIAAILRRPYAAIEIGDRAVVAGRLTVLHVAEAVGDAIAEGDRIARGADTWRVAAPAEPDGRGMLAFRLETV